jgi:hypothetical protein
MSGGTGGTIPGGAGGPLPGGTGGPIPQALTGIVINQNAPSNGEFTLDERVYQTFTLPADYERGTDSGEKLIPMISGLQVRVSVDTDKATTASLAYTFEYQTMGAWNVFLSGVATGAPHDGIAWFRIDFSELIEVPASMLTTLFRFSVVAQSDVAGIEYTTPNPLNLQASSQGEAFEQDGATPITPAHASVNFRLLSLTADSGTDFLGNEKRSVVVINPPSNVLANDGTYWQSPPLPSPFAVVSHYYDVRPKQIAPTQQLANQVPDPSFEYDAPNTTPADWGNTYNGGNITTFQAQTGWSDSGVQSARLTTNSGAAVYVGTTTGVVSAIAGTTYTIATKAKMLTLSANTVPSVVVWWLDSNNNIITSINLLGTHTLTTPQVISAQGIAPPGTVAAIYWVGYANGGSGTCDGYFDSCLFGPGSLSYADGDQPGYQWTGQAGQSATVQLIEPDVSDDFIVIDSVHIDPLTPHMAMNVYYSQDDAYTNNNMTESDWEQKLWTRVPKSYILDTSQEYVFPEPIWAKYVKLEFTNLQAQPYNPGPLNLPVHYKKFPTWVAQYFIAQIATPAFVTQAVDVQYDALTLAYQYYLDDIQQLPNHPSAPPTDALNQLTDFFQAAPTGIDATTLAKIDLTLDKWSQTQGAMIDNSTALGQFVASVFLAPNSPIQQTSEASQLPIKDYSTVSTLNRTDVLFEQSMPVMYFFLTCRHGYKEVYGQFEYHRAYIAGIQSVSFLRHDYSTPIDQSLYIESGGDSFNAERSDFVVDDQGIWRTYDVGSTIESTATAISTSGSAPPPPSTGTALRLSPRVVG